MNEKELAKIYEEELKRKDEIIARLREENHLLLKTALKRAEDRLDVQRKIDALHNDKAYKEQEQKEKR